MVITLLILCACIVAPALALVIFALCWMGRQADERNITNGR